MAQIGSTNVSMDTIKSTLKGGGGSVSDDLLTFFTAGAKINPWSKYKPIHTGYVNDDFLDINSSHFADANYGLIAPTTNSELTAWNAYKKVITSNDYSGLQWSYELPKGGSSSPYRLGDFRLYNPDARSPFFEVSCEASLWTPNQNYTVEVYNRYGYLNDGQVALGEMTDYHNLYLGVIIGKGGTEGKAEYVFTGGTVAAHYGVQNITCRISTEGTYWIAPVLCQSPENTSVAGIQSNKYTLLPVKPLKIVVEAAITSTTLYGSASIASNGDLYVNISMTNATTSSLSFNNVTIQVGYQNSVGTGTLFSGVIGSYTVGSYKKVTANKTFLASGLVAEAQQGKLFYRIIANSGSYTSGEKQLSIAL